MMTGLFFFIIFFLLIFTILIKFLVNSYQLKLEESVYKIVLQWHHFFTKLGEKL